LLDDHVGAAGLPKTLASLLAVASIVLFFGSARRRPEMGDTALPVPPAKHLRAAGLLALAVGYVALLPLLGYAVTLFLFLAAVALYAGARFSVALVTITLAAAVVLWATFVHVLRVPMPSGFSLGWPA
jgi:hypothetical protein